MILRSLAFNTWRRAVGDLGLAPRFVRNVQDCFFFILYCCINKIYLVPGPWESLGNVFECRSAIRWYTLYRCTNCTTLSQKCGITWFGKVCSHFSFFCSMTLMFTWRSWRFVESICYCVKVTALQRRLYLQLIEYMWLIINTCVLINSSWLNPSLTVT